MFEKKATKAKADKTEEKEEFIPKVTTVDKGAEICEVEGCFETKEPGQTYVCSKHVRAG
jgi:hypothetical protein